MSTQLKSYYSSMSSRDIMKEFRELVAEWQEGDASYECLKALTTIWYEMDSRGVRLPTAPELGDVRVLGNW